MNRISITATAVAIWLGLALLIDRLVLSQHCLACSNALTLDMKIKLPAADMSYPPVSLLVLLLIPMVISALVLLPWKGLRSKTNWQEALARWCQPWFWLAIAIVLSVLGESLFLMTKEYLPKALTTLAEKVTLIASVTVDVKCYKENTPFILTASLSGFLGLIIGSYLFLEKGVAEILKLPKNI